jgi:hypothetical protein
MNQYVFLLFLMPGGWGSGRLAVGGVGYILLYSLGNVV